MNITVLVSTMHKEKPLELVDQMNIKSDAIIVNQNDDKREKSKSDLNKQRISTIFNTDRGLSKSRNTALNEVQNGILVIADDDVVYHSNYINIISKAYEKYSDADCIAFYVKSTNVNRPTTVIPKEGRIGFLKSMKLASFQLTFKKTSLDRAGVKFNESFGAGAKYSMGEENIFLFECLKKRLKIVYCPLEIGVVNHAESTWFNGYTPKFFSDLGAAYYEMFSLIAPLMLLQYAVRKNKLYKNKMSLINALRYMLLGMREYKKNKKITYSHRS